MYKILKLNNINIVDLDHNKLEMLYLKGLLNEDLMIKIFQSMTKHEIGVTAYSNYEFWEEDIKRGINLL